MDNGGVGRRPRRRQLLRGWTMAVAAVAVVAMALAVERLRAAVAQATTCTPASTGPEENITAPARYEDALRTAVSPVAFGVQTPGAVVHTHDGDPMSQVQLDLLRHLRIQSHPCFQRSASTPCGLSPTHPATSGITVYDFHDPEANLQGVAVQTEVAGICLDAACLNLTTVALHRVPIGGAGGSAAACSYQLVRGGNLTSIVAALSTVEEVNMDKLMEHPQYIKYGVVVRNADRRWNARGYRDVVRPLPVNTSPVCCNLSTLSMAGLDTYAADLTPAGDPVPGSSSPLPANASGSLPPGCGSCDGPSASAPPSDPATATALLSEPAAGSFPAPPVRFVHIGDVGNTGALATKCSRHGDTLRVAAAAAASTQDAVATGLEGRVFLSDPPPLVSEPEIWLSAVAALQGLVALFYLTFLPKDGGWVARLVRAEGNGEISPRQRRNGRRVLVVLASILAVAEVFPLLWTLRQEREAANWVGLFAHLDLVAVMPGPAVLSDAPLPPPPPVAAFPPVPPEVVNGPLEAAPCSTGVVFMLLPVLGRASYIDTNVEWLWGILGGTSLLVVLLGLCAIGPRAVRLVEQRRAGVPADDEVEADPPPAEAVVAAAAQEANDEAGAGRP